MFKHDIFNQQICTAVKDIFLLMPEACCGAVGGAKAGDREPTERLFLLLLLLPLPNICGSHEHKISICLPLHGIMVVFVDFEDEAEDSHVDPSALVAGLALPSGSRPFPHHRSIASITGQTAEPVELDRPNPNINALSEALGCYPYALIAAELKKALLSAPATDSLRQHHHTPSQSHRPQHPPRSLAHLPTDPCQSTSVSQSSRTADPSLFQ